MDVADWFTSNQYPIVAVVAGSLGAFLRILIILNDNQDINTTLHLGQIGAKLLIGVISGFVAFATNELAPTDNFFAVALVGIFAGLAGVSYADIFVEFKKVQKSAEKAIIEAKKARAETMKLRKHTNELVDRLTRLMVKLESSQE